MEDVNDSPQAKAIKEALWAFGQEQLKVYRDKPYKIARMGINRTTWRLLDEAIHRRWRRDMRPDLYTAYGEEGLSFANGLAWYSFSGKHRLTRLRNFTTGDWCDLEEDVHLPDGVIELIYVLPGYKEAGHIVDITPLLEVGKGA